MLPIDNDIRSQILNSTGNVVISASAGTGKTYTTVKRIVLDISQTTNYQTYAAVTFTRKAAKEIRERLGPNIGDGYIGTNDNFVLTEIIQPFIKDVYGIEYRKEIKQDFTVVNSINNFQTGLERIKESGFLCKYRNRYKNFAFQLALDILKKSDSAKRYFKSKYFRIYIDEYQDCDVDMHNLFLYICESLQIPLFIVGDIKQSIYGWRGAYSDGFKKLISDQNFNTFNLWHNFRSNTVIQNYSNIFMNEVRENYQTVDFRDEVVSCIFSSELEAVQYLSSWIDSKMNCSFLHFRRDAAEQWSELLVDSGQNFIYIPASPLDVNELESEHIWIARLVAYYLLEDRYNEYDVYAEIPFPEAYEFRKIRTLLESIRSNLNNLDAFRTECCKLYSYLGYPTENEVLINEIHILFSTANNSKFKPTYNQKKYQFTSGTIHSSKGLEYDQVIIMGNDYNLNNDNDRYLHYVAVSRPKCRLLILVFDDARGKGYIQEIGRVIDQTNTQLGINIKKENIIKTEYVQTVLN
ncbi:UvrD-helicase domain-containing protein [Paenibacillus sp. 2TAB23]|uniref:UvrD-helicase domain-containing protein n=1 Tax=Paenibacillus sp. 2TAB23 TaxID=3233004 RepID=UPI003F9B9B65